MSDLDWRQRAHCVGRDPELWFPAPKDTHTAERARQICALCPVRAECDAEAAQYRINHGIWAGKRRFPPKYVPRERDVMPCGTNAAYARHLRNGETPCGPCLQANAARSVERYQQSVERRANR